MAKKTPEKDAEIAAEVTRFLRTVMPNDVAVKAMARFVAAWVVPEFFNHCRRVTHCPTLPPGTTKDQVTEFVLNAYKALIVMMEKDKEVYPDGRED